MDKKHNVQNAVAVAAAYIYRGDGALGEQFALEAQRLAEHEIVPQHLREMVWLALADAWTTQGRFNEAGYLMMERAFQSRRPNYFILVAAFSYFLANNLPPTILPLIRFVLRMISAVTGFLIPMCLWRCTWITNCAAPAHRS